MTEDTEEDPELELRLLMPELVHLQFCHSLTLLCHRAGLTSDM